MGRKPILLLAVTTAVVLGLLRLRALDQARSGARVGAAPYAEEEGAALGGAAPTLASGPEVRVGDPRRPADSAPTAAPVPLLYFVASSGAGPESQASSHDGGAPIASGTARLTVSTHLGEVELRLPIADGAAAWSLPPELADTSSLETFLKAPRGVVHDEEGQLFSIVSVRPLEESNAHLVAVQRITGWPIQVLAADGSKLPDAQIQVRLLPRSRWHAPVLVAPPPSADDVDVAFSGGIGTLPAQTNPNAVYWIGAEGFSWSPMRWARRSELGRTVYLERPARLAVEAKERDSLSDLRAELFHPDGIWRQMPLFESRTFAAGSEPTDVPAGTYLVVLKRTSPAASSETGDPSLVEQGRLASFEPGVTTTLRLDLRNDTPVRVVASAPADFSGTRWSISYLGTGVPGTPRTTLAKGAFERSGGPGSRAIAELAELVPGFYAFTVDARVSYPFELPRDSDSWPSEVAFDVEPFGQYAVYLPQRADSTSIAYGPGEVEPTWVGLAVVVGLPHGWPTLPFPSIQNVKTEARFVEIDAPPGSTAIVSYQDSAMIEGGRIELDAQGSLEVALTGRRFIDLSSLVDRPPIGWFSEVRFRDSTGSDVTYLPLMAVDSLGFSGVGVEDERISEIYLPSFEGSESLDGWYALPVGATTVDVAELARLR